MKRLEFVSSAAAALALAVSPASDAAAAAATLVLGSGGTAAAVKAARAKATSMTVRHVDAEAEMRVALTPARLAALTPFATTHAPHDLSAAFDAIVAAKPILIRGLAEARWHVTFSDHQGRTVMTLTTAIGRPRYGSIDDEPLLFSNRALVLWLAKRFAPQDLPYVKA